jgi:hypothetical protein
LDEKFQLLGAEVVDLRRLRLIISITVVLVVPRRHRSCTKLCLRHGTRTNGAVIEEVVVVAETEIEATTMIAPLVENASIVQNRPRHLGVVAMQETKPEVKAAAAANRPNPILPLSMPKSPCCVNISGKRPMKEKQMRTMKNIARLIA